MNCLLVAATVNEIAPVIARLRANRQSPDIDVLVSGVGLVATTYSLVKQLSLKKPSLIIQAGVAGCFDTNIPLGSVVVIKRDVIADQGVIENNQLTSMFDLGFADPNHLPYKKSWLINPHKDLLRKTGLKAVSAVSVNQVSTDKRSIALFREKYKPAIESMEGAALHYTAILEQIPFLQIRSISNYTGERKKKNWKIREAIQNLDNELDRIITTTGIVNPKP